MGQYFIILNLNKEEYISPHTFGEGAKIFEFTGLTMTALTTLLTRGVDPYFQKSHPLLGSWSGDHLVIVGDETEDEGELLSADQLSRLKAHEEAAEALRDHLNAIPFIFAKCLCKDIGEELLLAMCHCDHLTEHLVNLLQHEFYGPSEDCRRRMRELLFEEPAAVSRVVSRPLSAAVPVDIDWDALESRLYSVTASILQEFSVSEEPERVALLCFACYAEFGIVEIYCDTKHTISDLEEDKGWDVAASKYALLCTQPFQSTWESGFGEFQQQIQEAVAEELGWPPPTVERFLAAVCKVAVRLEREGALDCLPKAAEFSVFVIDNDDDFEEANARLEDIRED